MFAHVVAAAAVIQLHGIFADHGKSKAPIVLAVAHNAARIICTIGTQGNSEVASDSALPTFEDAVALAHDDIADCSTSMSAFILIIFTHLGMSHTA